MIRLKDLLFEEKMTTDQALSLLGLTRTDLGDQKRITTAWRKKSKDAHPDIGGSLELQKQINNAKDLLQKMSGGNRDRIDWDKIHAEYKKLGKQIKETLLKSFKSKIFTDYFKTIYNQSFESEVTSTHPLDREHSPSSAGFSAEFFNKDRSIVFKLRVSASLTDIKQSKSLGGSDNISFSVYLDAYGFYNNRKVKMSQRDWKFTHDHTFFKNPDLVFPEVKLKKNISMSDKPKKFTKKDMITYLTAKLKASWDSSDGGWARIPVSKDGTLKFTIYRMTLMRVPAWSVNGLYKNWTRISRLQMMTFPEDVETAKFFDKLQKGAMSKKSEDAVAKYLTSEIKKARVKLYGK